MAQRGVGRRLTFQEVAHLQPGDRLLEVDDSPWGGRCLLVVESIPQLTTAPDGGHRLTFRGILEANGRVVDYGLSEHGYAHSPRLYRPEPVLEEPASSLPLIDPAYTRPGLGELDILSDLDTVFLLGEFVAGLNAQGTLVHVGFLADVTLSPRTGCWAFFATDHLEAAAFTPALAAGQFAGLQGEPLRALLAGYAHRAYQVLEPTTPGFAQQLVAQFLPEPVPVVPVPRPAQFNLAAVLQAYGTRLAFDSEQWQLVFTPPSAPVHSPTDWDVLLASLVVFITQRDLTAWLLQVAACEPSRELSTLLGALARGELQDPEWSGLLPRLLGSYRPQQQLRARLARQPQPQGGLLRLFAELYGQAQRLEAVYASASPYRILRATLDQFPTVPAERVAVRGQVLTSLMDGLDQLALAADARGHTHCSLEMAQYSLMALQLLPPPSDSVQAEAWLSQVQAPAFRYQWRDLAMDQPLVLATVWQFAGYAGSTILSVRPFCDAAGEWYRQGQVTNQFWSAAWWSLGQIRKALRLGYALSQQQPLPAENVRPQVALALEHLLSHYHKALRNLLDMLLRSGEMARPSGWSEVVMPADQQEEDSFLVRELRLSTAVFEAVQAHGYGPAALLRLGELVAAL